MNKIETEILINAGRQKVWQVLTDYENHPCWNPFIQLIQGDRAAGGKLTVHIKPPGGKRMIFKPDILKFEPEREFRWKGKFGIKGIFDGEHYFILEETGEHQTKFIHGEIFSGILVGLMGGALANTRDGFVLMNEALKKECEMP